MPPQPTDTDSRPDVAVIDYGMGNLRSVLKAFEAAAGRARLVTRPSEIGSAEALVFPGQGAIVDTMRLLKDTGFDVAIRTWIAEDRPFFGICLGLQALFEHSEEGDTPGLGVFPGRVKRFRLDSSYKVPHMGWNNVHFAHAQHPLLEGLSPEEFFYFVHSYHVETPLEDLAWGRTDYGYPFVSAVKRGRCIATQFHPEKSQSKGLRMYANFLRWIRQEEN